MDQPTNPGTPPVSARNAALGSGLLFLLSIAALVLLMAFKLNVHARILDKGYQISQEKNRQNKLLQEKSKLDLEYEYLRSPARINEIAETQFSMSIPASADIVHLKAGSK